MQLLEKVGKVRSSGDFETKAFTIKASRKAFEILSAGLYSDKVRAIIRELSTNAMDAHIAAGKPDLPFAIHIPTRWEPEFSVEDFGIGLSDDGVQNVYTTYFESDKINSNDFTGCLGLGSKSPFSYTDSFMITSRFNGMESTYTAFLDEAGMPTITKLLSKSCKEGNGVKVSFPVKADDCYDFNTKAAKVLRWFKVKPTITGASVSWNDHSYIFEGDGFKLRDEHGKTSYVVMGNVAYPIVAGELTKGVALEDDKKINSLLSWGIELTVNIGEVDIAASREKLGYDKTTVSNLRKKLLKAYGEFQENAIKEIDTMPTIWQARMKFNEVHAAFSNFNFSATWNGKPLERHVKIGNDSNGSPLVKAERIKVKGRYGDSVSIKKNETVTVIECSKDVTVFLNDTRGAYTRIRKYLNDCNDRYGKEVILLHSYPTGWLEETGLIEVAKPISSLPAPDRASGGERGRSLKTKMYEFDPNACQTGGSKNATYWKPVEVDFDEQDGIFVEILWFKYRTAETGDCVNEPQNLTKLYSNLQTLFGEETKIYGIRPSDRALLSEAEGEWTPLRTFLKEKMPELDAKYALSIQMEKALEKMQDYNETRIPYYFKNLEFTSPSKFGEFTKMVEEAEKVRDIEGRESYKMVRYWAEAMLPEIAEDNTLRDMQREVIKQYPLIPRLNYASYSEAKDLVALQEYVSMIDAKNASK